MITAALQEAVFRISNALLWPVVALLLVAVGHVLFLAGETLVEALRRRGRAEAIRDPAAPPASMAGRHGVREWLRLRAEDAAASPWLVMDRTEAALAARVDRARLWVKLGPALGLAGTLIPLGPALLALAKNDLTALAEGLILAFGTTVLGLAAAGLAWVLATTTERWYRLDLSELRHALEALEAAGDAATSPGARGAS